MRFHIRWIRGSSAAALRSLWRRAQACTGSRSQTPAYPMTAGRREYRQQAGTACPLDSPEGMSDLFNNHAGGAFPLNLFHSPQLKVASHVFKYPCHGSGRGHVRSPDVNLARILRLVQYEKMTAAGLKERPGAQSMRPVRELFRRPRVKVQL